MFEAFCARAQGTSSEASLWRERAQAVNFNVPARVGPLVPDRAYLEDISDTAALESGWSRSARP